MLDWVAEFPVDQLRYHQEEAVAGAAGGLAVDLSVVTANFIRVYFQIDLSHNDGANSWFLDLGVKTPIRTVDFAAYSVAVPSGVKLTSPRAVVVLPGHNIRGRSSGMGAAANLILQAFFIELPLAQLRALGGEEPARQPLPGSAEQRGNF